MTVEARDKRCEASCGLAAPELLEQAMTLYERTIREWLGFVREIARTSCSAPRMVDVFTPMAERRNASPDAYAVALLVAVRHGKCRSCLERVTDESLRAGADVGVVRAVLASDADALPPELACIYAFTQALVTGWGGSRSALRSPQCVPVPITAARTSAPTKPRRR